MLSVRAMGPIRRPGSLAFRLPSMVPSIVFRDHVRFGSMKIKRIQPRQPLQKNKIRRLMKGTRLEVKAPRKKKSEKNPDPKAYIDVKEVDFDPYDLAGRSTLKVRPNSHLFLRVRFADICQ
jgi:hypothetical protein